MQQHNRILAVDDNPTNIAILEELLSDDYELATAASGEEALEVADTFRPDLVLLDIMMPGIDGYETCQKMRTDPVLQGTKIVNSIGISILIEIIEKMIEIDGKLAFCCLTPTIEKTFHIMGLAQYAGVYADEESAVAELTP